MIQIGLIIVTDAGIPVHLMSGVLLETVGMGYFQVEVVLMVVLRSLGVVHAMIAVMETKNVHVKISPILNGLA